MKVGKNTVARFTYELFDEEGTAIDSTEGREPVAFLPGASNVVWGLEKALVGKEAGDAYETVVKPGEGYGDWEAERVQRVSAKKIGDRKKMKPGHTVMFRTPQGPMRGRIIKVGRTTVDVDMNHPWAGKTLTFKGEIVDVREATHEEIQHGHPHGPGGHQH